MTLAAWVHYLGCFNVYFKLPFNTVNEELTSSGLFEVMNINTDEDEHSIEMQLPYIAKVMEGLVVCRMKIFVICYEKQ